jgi:hypothetical protein
LNLDEIGTVIIGVTSSMQLEEIVSACAEATEMTVDNYRNFAWSDEEILDPFRWNISNR